MPTACVRTKHNVGAHTHMYVSIYMRLLRYVYSHGLIWTFFCMYLCYTTRVCVCSVYVCGLCVIFV